MMVEVGGLRFHIVDEGKGIGHWVQLEAAERLNALLLEFLPKRTKAFD